MVSENKNIKDIKDCLKDINKKLKENTIVNINDCIKESVTKHAQNKEKLKIDDNIFINILKKSPIKTAAKKKILTKTIYNNMRILSPKKLKIPEIKYYKFPFNDHTQNDKSFWYENFYMEWKCALKAVYKNFIKNDVGFYLKFGKDCIEFENKKVVVDENLRELFLKNDVQSKNMIFEGNDIALVFDLIINYDFVNFSLPFILCRNEFENGIMYKCKVKDLGIVQNKEKLVYNYFLDGYFWGNDYNDLFEYEVMVNVLN